MIQVSVKEARSTLSQLLNKVRRGEEVVVTRHGKTVARLVPPGTAGRLPSLEDFRRSIQVPGGSLSKTVVNQRREERF